MAGRFEDGAQIDFVAGDGRSVVLVSLATTLEHPIGAIADREKRKARRSEGAGGIVIAIAVHIAS